ncbi:MAG: CRISPR-associated endonuclease Cas3'' [Clostridiales bacterium]|nr:CRISPR-associated endonuclease Cas3'' [Clostridiales bacterium]
MMEYYAHSNEKGEYQTVREHLHNVGRFASMYSGGFGAGEFGYLCGILHDIGKNSDEFQNRLLKNGPKVDHSTAGAIEAKKLLGKAFGTMLSYVICGHHSGLMDYGSAESGLMNRFNKNILVYN